MSAKWRALQHRHRYTYSAVTFPLQYTQSLNSNKSSLKFFTELKHLVSLNSTYAQVEHVKKLASAFTELLSSAKDDNLVSQAVRFYLEILFFENSLPLHRTLLSVLAKTRSFESLLCGCFRGLFYEYGGLMGRGRRFCLSRAALSVMGLLKLGFLVGVVEECAVLVSWDVVLGLRCVVSEINELARPSPIVMEQCQEALSCLYYLLQRFPMKFKDLGGVGVEGGVGEECNVLEMVFAVILDILRSVAFSRDCFVAAGVSFCAALQVCLSAEELGLFIIEVVFDQKTYVSGGSPMKSSNEIVSKLPFKGDLYMEIQKLALLSRLCLTRGILTAVSRAVLNTHFSVLGDDRDAHDSCGSGGLSIKTILFDGILPQLCNYCENPSDSHFNFHALTVLQICLQQIKTLMLADLSNTSDEYEPIPEEMSTRIMRIIWNNLEDPLSQTVKQVHLIFDLFLDIQACLCRTDDSSSVKSFSKKIALDLLRLGPRCKGRYVPLASLTKRLGAKTLFAMSPDLLSETVLAYVDDDVCCAVTSFLKCFLEQLRDECWSSDGVERGYSLYRGHCLSPFMFGLASGVSKLRTNLNTYALPVLLEVDVDSIFPMLAFVSIWPAGVENGIVYPELESVSRDLKVEQQVAILVSLLKVSRFLQLLEGDIDLCNNSLALFKEGRLEAENCYAIVCIKAVGIKVPVDWLVLALTHIDEHIRVDAAESLFSNPKTASLPSHLELYLMRMAVPLNMRCCLTAFQMKWVSLFRKFFSRVRTALDRQYKQGRWQPIDYSGSNGDYLLYKTEEGDILRADDLFKFMRWLSSFLLFSCYPSAPYKRKIMAMELIQLLINVWSIIPSQVNDVPGSLESCVNPYSKGFTSPDCTLLLVGSIIDSWDRLRESSFRILLHFPTPLPGISNGHMVEQLIVWSKSLVCSPRVRESDAGALTLRLIFRKYVLELGWIVRASVNVHCFNSSTPVPNEDSQIQKSGNPVMEYINSLIDWLNHIVEEGERDLSEACKKSFVHGVLLALRYTFEELDWNSHEVLSNTIEMKQALEKLLGLIMRITSLALWVVSSDAWYLPEDMDDMVDDEAFLSEVPGEVNALVSSLQLESIKPVQDVTPPQQIVMVGCWLAIKEVSLLFGTIIRKIPLPSSWSDSSALELSESSITETAMPGTMLDMKQLETIGGHFLEILLKMKHNGAIDKTRAGFTAVCNRLLCSNDPRLCKLTESWMDHLMERTVAKGQVVNDLLRRSAGIPAAFIALFLSEPEGAPKKLLPRALRWLIDVANGSMLNPAASNGGSSDLCKSSSTKSNDLNGGTSKVRDEGVVPTVHAFNVLRTAFNDTNLATDTSGFSAEAMIVAIRSFSSPYWEVRNSACLAYTALVRRMVGFLNVQKRESVRRAITGLEFFHRYPSLHTFLLSELKVATEWLNESSEDESNLATVVHPSLCPMLILLSRLKPSPISSESGDVLDPFLFMPFIRKCSTQSNLRVRVLASRALIGLISNEKLEHVLLSIASELPQLKNENVMTSTSSTLLHTTNWTHHSFNLIHGMLLQLGFLLDTNCRNLADSLKKDQILSELLKVVLKCTWIASPRLCPCPILNTSFLRVLDHMLSIVRTYHNSKNYYPIRDLLLELSTVCIDVGASYVLPYYDPTIAELREQAAISYLSCVFQPSEEIDEETFLMPHKNCQLNMEILEVPGMVNAFDGFRERLICSLTDSSYEVRLATLKWLLKFVKSTESVSKCYDLSRSEIRNVQDWTKTNIQMTMMQLLTTESNRRCMCYIVRILFSWNLLQFKKLDIQSRNEAIYLGTMDCDSVFQFWNKLISLYNHTRHTKTRETLICCMGICVKKFSGLFTSFELPDERKTTGYVESEWLGHLTRLFECITYFVNLIKGQSSSSEPINMRRAAAESLVASGLLQKTKLIGPCQFDNQIPSSNQIPSEELCSIFEPKESVSMFSRILLDAWFVCIKLLEDEDDVIRHSLAVDVHKCFTSNRSGVVPSQVEQVIGLSFEFLSSTFKHWIEYFDHLCRSVLDASTYMGTKGDLVRRVFDKEIDNHHEEKLLIIQISCLHMETNSKSLVQDLHGTALRSYFCDWRMRFCNQCTSFAKDHTGNQEAVDWIGGVGNHKDAFLPLYGSLLGFYALSKCILNFDGCKLNGDTGDCMQLASNVVELGRTINPFLKNPLISSLFSCILRVHENMSNSTSTFDQLFPTLREKDSMWSGFNPYFLLR